MNKSALRNNAIILYLILQFILVSMLFINPPLQWLDFSQIAEISQKIKSVLYCKSSSLRLCSFCLRQQHMECPYWPIKVIRKR